MIWGTIEHGLHPMVVMTIAGDKGSVTLPMLVDTGFDVDVALNFDFADRLGLEIYDTALFEYANGQCEEELLCRAQLNWHGQWLDIDVLLASDEQPAIGTRLLDGCILTMDFVRDRLVIDKPVQWE